MSDPISCNKCVIRNAVISFEINIYFHFWGLDANVPATDRPVEGGEQTAGTAAPAASFYTESVTAFHTQS